MEIISLRLSKKKRELLTHDLFQISPFLVAGRKNISCIPQRLYVLTNRKICFILSCSTSKPEKENDRCFSKPINLNPIFKRRGFIIFCWCRWFSQLYKYDLQNEKVYRLMNIDRDKRNTLFCGISVDRQRDDCLSHYFIKSMKLTSAYDRDSSIEVDSITLIWCRYASTVEPYHGEYRGFGFMVVPSNRTFGWFIKELPYRPNKNSFICQIRSDVGVAKDQVSIRRTGR
jgi:hypothetical protein